MRVVFSDPYLKNINKAGRYTDAATTGLNLNIKKNGGKYWVFRYSISGKRVDLSLGPYPEITLKEARKRALIARGCLLNGKPPSAHWKAAINQDERLNSVPKFKDFAKICIELKMSEWKNKKHTAQWFNTFETFVNPILGDMPIDVISTEDILKVLSPIWGSKTETASRVRGRIEWILAAAITRQIRSGPNPASWRGHLETLLPKPSKISKVIHHPALPYSKIPLFMSELRESNCISALALEFLILNCSRTKEVIGGLRSEISTSGIWHIPAERMKNGQDHCIPLAKRSQEILTIAKSLDPNSKFLFSRDGKPLSNMAMLMFLKGRCKDLTVHGFRSSFRDWVAEKTSHNPEVAEKALSHTIKSRVERAYRRGDLLDQRKKLMEDWEKYCQSKIDDNQMAVHHEAKVV